MVQSWQTWSDNYNIPKLKSAVTPSLDYWTQAITMSSSYQLPFGHDNYQGRKSLVLIQGPTRKGGIPRRVPTPQDLESFSFTSSKSYYRCSSHLKSSQNHIAMYLYWGWRLPPKSLHTLHSCLSWDSLPFLLATISTSKKKDPNTL